MPSGLDCSMISFMFFAFENDCEIAYSICKFFSRANSEVNFIFNLTMWYLAVRFFPKSC